MRRALGACVLAATTVFSLLVACGDDKKNDEEVPNPGRTDSAVPEAEAAPPALDCSKRQGKVSDTPVCDTCAKAKCCSEITACDKDPSCSDIQKCLEACSPEDFTCGLVCQEIGGTGTTLLQAVGSCARRECKTECAAAEADAAFDSPF